MTGQRPPVVACRSCGDSIIWCRTDTGAKMPVNLESDEHGNVRLTVRGSAPPLATVVSAGGREPGQKLYRSHFATCRRVEVHREKLAKRQGRPPAEQGALFA